MPLVDFRKAIIDAWQALEPDTRPKRRYRYIEKPATGASAHRGFWFQEAKGGDVTEQGRARHMIKHTFEARIALHLPERHSALFDEPYREYQKLAPAVRRIAMPRAIVPRVTGWFTEEVEGEAGDLDLVLTIEVSTKESSA
jgi:hypothetical protein